MKPETNEEIHKFTRTEWLQRFPHGQRKLQATLHANAVAKAAGEGLPVSRRVLRDYKSIHNHPLFRGAMEARGIDPRPIEVGCVATRPGKRTLNFYEAALQILQGSIQLHSIQETE